MRRRRTRPSPRRRDLHRDLHGQMVRGAAEPDSLQRDRLARVMHDRDPDEIPIADNAARRIEVDPAGTGNINLDPGMGVAAGSSSSSSSSARCRYPETNRAAMPRERNAAIMSIARSRQQPLPRSRVRTGSWIPFSCRATCLKVRLDRLRHADEQIVRVGGAVRARRNPALQRSSSGRRGSGRMKRLSSGQSSAA